MSEPLICYNCKSEMSFPYYVLNDPTRIGLLFCSRLCLVEYAAPELKQAIAIKQWIPTPEEEARMSE